MQINRGFRPNQKVVGAERYFSTQLAFGIIMAVHI